MTSNIKNFIVTNTNKIITTILTIIFIFSFFSYHNVNYLTIFTSVLLIALNVFNYFVLKKTYIFSEIVIYEVIALMGIFYVNWFYALVFVLITQLLRFFENKIVLVFSILMNSITYLIMYFSLSSMGITRGFLLWHILLILFIAVIISIYFINTEVNDSKVMDIEEEKNFIEQKYYELLQEHKNVLILKQIMDFSNNVNNIANMASNMNELLLNSFENIDYSTILLYDETRGEFKVASSNVSSHYHKVLCKIDQFELFEDVINNTYGKVISSQIGFKYPSAEDRRICSAFCMPLHTNKNLIGIILLESRDTEAFKDMDINQFNIVRYNMSLVIENKQWVNKIEKMALVDGLTGVYNRNYLFQFLEEQFKLHSDNNKKLCMVLYDIDHFKKFNDTYGHLFGDLVLKELSKLVKNSIREVDLIARYGGEEFIIVLTDTDKEIAKQRIEQIRRKIENMIVKDENGTEARVTVSFGIAEFSDISYNITIKQLIERSDQALYKSKENGRNQVTVFE